MLFPYAYLIWLFFLNNLIPDNISMHMPEIYMTLTLVLTIISTVIVAKNKNSAVSAAKQNLIVKAVYGDTIDLSQFPLPTKEGYLASYNPTQIIMDDINGKTGSITWKELTFKVYFYKYKTDTEPFTQGTAKYGTIVTRGANNNWAPSANMKFSGWIDMDTDELVTSDMKFTYNYLEDKKFYINWAEYNSKITLYIANYETQDGFIEFASFYGDKDTTLSSVKIQNAVKGLELPENISLYLMGSSTAPMFRDKSAGTYVASNKGIVFNGNTELILLTAYTLNTIWEVPVFDENSYSYTDQTVSYSKTISVTSAIDNKSYNANFKCPDEIDLSAPTGYMFSHWVNKATGEKIETTSGGYISVNIKDGPEITYVAKFIKRNYKITINMNNGSMPDKAVYPNEININDTLTFENVVLMSQYNSVVTLPYVGMEEFYPFAHGYDFIGWQISGYTPNGEYTEDLEGIVLTKEFLEKAGSSGSIYISGCWEPREYNLNFYICMPDADMTLPSSDRSYEKAFTRSFKTGSVIDKDPTPDEKTYIDNNTPVGWYYSFFTTLDGSVLSRMPAHDVDIYAVYHKQTINMYIDYNNGKPIEESLENQNYTDVKVLYGDDITEFEKSIKGKMITSHDKPSDRHVIISWNVYHVDAGKNVYDKNNWEPGINDEGTNIAKTSIIYQPVWKHYNEFFFRVYDINSNLYMALGKDYQTYYWKANRICEQSETTYNDREDLYYVLFFKPQFENWDSSRVTDINMWLNLTISFKPFYVNKSVLTVDSMVNTATLIFKFLMQMMSGESGSII